MMTNLILNLQTTVMLQYYIDVAMIKKADLHNLVKKILDKLAKGREALNE